MFRVPITRYFGSMMGIIEKALFSILLGSAMPTETSVLNLKSLWPCR